MMPNVPIIGEQKKENPRFPSLHLNFQPQGMMISIVFDNGFSMTQVLAPDVMDQVVSQWKEVKKQQVTAMEMMNQIQKTKLH